LVVVVLRYFTNLPMDAKWENCSLTVMGFYLR
jgi:hypothetical protein